MHRDGGTVGDIESLPCLEAIRCSVAMWAASSDLGLCAPSPCWPYIGTSGEIKTKPTRQLR